MNAKEIKELCALGENSKVQFKLRIDNPSKIAAEIVAFANYRGGTILIGVEDKTGEIVGLTYDEVQQISRDVGNVANNSVRPTVYLQTETVDVDGKTVLVVNVNEGIDKPYKDQSGNIWIKQGSDKRRIVENAEMLALFQESGSFRPDEKGVRRTSINDIDMMLLNEYLEQYYGKRSDEFGLPVEQLLQNLQIMTKDGRVTLAGLQFFGKHPQMYEPAFVIKAVSFFGNDMGGLEYRDSKDITGTIPRMFEGGIAFLNANLHSIQAGQSFNSVGKLEISEVALKEILQNALVHRDYLIQAPIRIMIFDHFAQRQWITEAWARVSFEPQKRSGTSSLSMTKETSFRSSCSGPLRLSRGQIRCHTEALLQRAARDMATIRAAMMTTIGSCRTFVTNVPRWAKAKKRTPVAFWRFAVSRRGFLK